MLLDAIGEFAADPLAIEAGALRAEAEGFDAFAAPETQHDVFVTLALAARATSRIGLRSEIAVAFARNPMNVAVLGNDVQLISGGRFQLGLGSQVRAHIERRFSMPWSHPAARMEEFLAAVRAIWASWANGERVNFTGKHYRHTLMTPFFDPGPNPYGNPLLMLAAVGERMTEVAGRGADGLLCHSLTTEHYLREVTLPALRAARGGELDGFTVSLSVFVVLGETTEQRSIAEAGVRRQIAFYASTPAYRAVLDLHGWGDLHENLNRRSRAGEWDEMAAAIDDDVLAAFSVAGSPREVAAQLHERYGDVVTRTSFYTPYAVDPADLAATGTHLRDISDAESPTSESVSSPAVPR